MLLLSFEFAVFNIVRSNYKFHIQSSRIKEVYNEIFIFWPRTSHNNVVVLSLNWAIKSRVLSFL
jgi:hypothetical protein